jgi:glyceraldehyde-3-phosphate dehydrogenase (NADP+)
VFSTISSKDEYEPTILGLHLWEKRRLEAVDADAAFNNGQGVWPTMKVADRIKSMTCFVNGGYSRRGGEVFDVGNRKSLSDSQKNLTGP